MLYGRLVWVACGCGGGGGQVVMEQHGVEEEGVHT